MAGLSTTSIKLVLPEDLSISLTSLRQRLPVDAALRTKLAAPAGKFIQFCQTAPQQFETSLCGEEPSSKTGENVLSHEEKAVEQNFEKLHALVDDMKDEWKTTRQTLPEDKQKLFDAYTAESIGRYSKHVDTT